MLLLKKYFIYFAFLLHAKARYGYTIFFIIYYLIQKRDELQSTNPAHRIGT